MTEGPAPALACSPSTPNPPDRRVEDVGPPEGVHERRAENRASEALKMACPFCGASQSAVRRSRGAIVSDQVRRTRRCSECGEDFPTKEEVDYECLAERLSVRPRMLRVNLPDDRRPSGRRVGPLSTQADNGADRDRRFLPRAKRA